MLRMVSDEQVRRLLKLRKREKTLATTAAKAGMDEKTARKWLGSEKLPSQCKIERCSRTRADPFSEVWSEMEGILELNLPSYRMEVAQRTQKKGGRRKR